MAAKGIWLVAVICCFLLAAQGQPTEGGAAAVVASSTDSMPDSAITKHVTQPPTVSLQTEEIGTVPSSANLELPVRTSGRPPRLFPLVSPLSAFTPDLGAMSADVGALDVTPAPIRGVFLPRSLYGPAAAAARAAPVPPVEALAAAAAAVDATAEGDLVAQATGKAITQNGIQYHSPNPVMRTLKLVPMFYGSWTATQKTLVTTFLSGLGGSSWMGINNLYSDTTGPIASATGLYKGQNWTFTNTTPGTSLSDAQVQSLIQQGISNITGALLGSGGDTDTLYMLLTGPDIGQGTSGSAFCTQYCGWHTWYKQSNGVYVKYLWAGNAFLKCPGACISSTLTATNSPNGDKGIDGMLSVVAHEITEAATDPRLNAWYRNTDGAENADICAWQFGTIYTNAAGKKYNVQDINGNYYLLQKNHNPNTGKCALAV